jgi:hypothetical protein
MSFNKQINKSLPVSVLLEHEAIGRLSRKESLNIPLEISSGDDACALCS